MPLFIDLVIILRFFILSEYFDTFTRITPKNYAIGNDLMGIRET